MISEIQNALEKNVKLVLLMMAAIILVFAIACAPAQTSNDKQRERQNEILNEGVAQTGLPAIVNFREAKLLKDIYELRDQEDFSTYTYLWSDYQGKWVFLCDSIGYPIPYSTQFTASETMQTYNVTAAGAGTKYYGVERLPQAEPNGLFSPASAEGSWVMCKNPNGKSVHAVYLEPRAIASPFKLP